MRLSWPTKGDARRALVLKDAVRKSKTVFIPEGRRVHVSFLDVELHNHLTGLAERGKFLKNSSTNDYPIG